MSSLQARSDIELWQMLHECKTVVRETDCAMTRVVATLNEDAVREELERRQINRALHEEAVL